MAGASHERDERIRRRLEVHFGPTPAAIRTGFTRDLSDEGVALESHHLHRPGTGLFLRLTLPTNETVSLQGVVAWARADMRSEGGTMGVQLLVADARYRAYLARMRGPRLAIAEYGSSLRA